MTKTTRSETPLLRARGIVKHFGGVKALRSGDVDIFAGEVHAVMGENGAGKSTFGKIIAGAIDATAGDIEFDGRQVQIRNPIDAQRLGIAIIFQELDLFPNLSIAENIVIRNLAFPERLRVDRKRMRAFCQPLLEKVGLDIDPATLVGDLHIGHQQLVAIARALSMNARVIVFDESTSALTEESVEGLFAVIDTLRKDGVACVYVSHKMDEIFRIPDRITVLRDGEYVGTRRASETNHSELVTMMVGHAVTGKERAQSHATDQPLLKVENLKTELLAGVNFTLHRGEVLGLAGLVGAGRGDIGRALFGLERVAGGSIHLRDREICPRSPRKAVTEGIGLLPRNRKVDGLMMQMSVRANQSLASLRRFSTAGLLRLKSEAQATDEVTRQTRLKAASPHIEVNALSGGNQQKSLLSRWLIVDPDIYFLDDPTRGVDVGAKEDIYALIEEMAARGKGVLLVSSELPELLRCCDRIVVLNQGRQTAIVDPNTTSQEEILHHAMEALA